MNWCCVCEQAALFPAQAPGGRGDGTYGVLAGSKEPIEKIGLIGVKEMYNSLNVPVPGMVEAIRCLKEAALGLLNNEDAEETAPYFDYMIQAMS